MRKIVIGILILCSNHFYAQEAIYNMGSFQMHDAAQMGCFGDFINDSSMIENNGVLFLTGTAGIQTFSGSGTYIFDSVEVTNADHILIEQEFKVVENVKFVLGNLATNRASIDSQFVHFLAGSNYNGASDASFIDGVAAKTGNTAFDFPVGDTDELRLVGISDPTAGTDQFKAFYLNDDPDPVYSTLAIDISCLDHVSRCEYWIVNRTIGLADVSVRLNYGVSSCGVDLLCDLLVARWNGSQWISEGNGGVTGTISNGEITTGDGCGSCGTPQLVTAFSPFTLGSFSPNNPLPITLVEFSVTQEETSAILEWETASEFNNDYYRIDRSQDGIVWNYFGTVQGAGTSSERSNYQLIDDAPLNGVSYYRLTQVDNNGTKLEIGIESLQFLEQADYRIQPNPATTVVQIYYKGVSPTHVTLFSASGRQMNVLVNNGTNGFISIELDQVPPGVYYLNLRKNDEIVVEKIVVI